MGAVVHATIGFISFSLVGYIALYLVVSNNGYHLINTDTGTMQIFLNTTNNNCNPAYITWEMTTFGNIYPAIFSQYGFTINCSMTFKELFGQAHNRRKPILSRQSKRKIFTHTTCHQYNASHSNQFCNGGRIHHINYPTNPLLTRSRFVPFRGLDEKDKISKILTEYCNNQTSKNVCDFKLLSFNLDDSKQRIEFLSKRIDCTKSDPQHDKTWVFKEHKHQGSGVHFFDNHQLIYRLLSPDLNEQNEYFSHCQHLQPIQKRKFFKDEGFTFHRMKDRVGFKVSYEQLILQEFISNPLLIENKAQHLRIYGLIASYFDPFIALYFSEGIFYLNAHNYSHEKLDKNVLRTNGHVADADLLQTDRTFKRRWGFHKFQNYLNQNFGRKMFNYTTDKLNNDIKHITHHIFKAAYYDNTLQDFANQKNWFNKSIVTPVSIYCMDFVITDTFELKFLELNFNCGAECRETMIDNDGHEWVCDQFAKESVDITFEIHAKKSINSSVETMESLKQFKIAFRSDE